MEKEDPEIDAMVSIVGILSGLEREAQERILVWAAGKLGLKGNSDMQRQVIGAAARARPSREGTLNTVSARLGVKSCRDLFKAAAIHMTLYQGKERFSRSEWVSSAKDSKYWKVDYSAQMATTVTRLLQGGFVNEIASDVFSVTDEELRQLEAKIS